MKALDLLATEENIYTTFIDDAIGRDADVFSFVSFLNSLDSGTVIALNARWGEGKTKKKTGDRNTTVRNSIL